MEDFFPDIESFTPWKLDDSNLDNLISKQYNELKNLYDSERSYKVSITMALENLINQQKMNNYCKIIEKKWNN